MTTKVTNLFSINGAIDTNRSVLDNINDIATACASFVTYDINTGKWSVVINTTGTSVASFNDSNIIGNIDISGSGVNELYNQATIEFPNKDLRGAIDYIDININSVDRFSNELDNRLNFRNDLINDSAQALYIASIELKQSRLDKIIQFRTDYSYLELKAGSIIDITNSVYGYTSKLFRVIKVEEEDSDGLLISITAQEYDANIYSTSGLEIANRTKRTKIPPRNTNDELVKNDSEGTGDQLKRLLVANVLAGLFNPSQNGLLGNIMKSVMGVATDSDGDIIDSDGNKILSREERLKDKILGNVKVPSLSTISRSSAQICEGQTVTVTVTYDCESCLFDIPALEYDYTITGVLQEDITVPLTGTVTVSGNSGTLSIPTTATAGGAESQTMSVTIGGLNTSIEIYDQKDYTYSVARSATSITEGQSVTITLTATGSKANATIPYVISGSATSRVSSPALSGNVTTSGGTATLVIVTTDDAVFTGSGGLTITFEPSLVDICNTVGTRTTTVTVLDNDVAPPSPSNCEYVSVPMVWCGEFNGSDDQLQGLSVRSSIRLPVPRAGEAYVEVPTAVSVTKGSPSTITVTSTTNVASSALQATMGGQAVNIITSFDSVGPLGLITGTTITLYGY